MTVAPTSVHPRPEQHRSRWALVAILSFLLGGLAVGLLYQSDVFRGSSSSTTEGSGVSATESRDLDPFKSVELAGSNNVLIRVGEKQSVVVRADHNLLNRVTTDVQSGKLVVGNTPGSFTTRSPMSVEVDVPTLNQLTLAGSGNIVASNIEAHSLEVILSGSGTLNGSGAAKRLDVRVSGSGTVHFERLAATDARTVVSGVGSIFVTATKDLDASVSGVGAIVYSGNPQHVTKSVTGEGAVTGA